MNNSMRKAYDKKSKRAKVRSASISRTNGTLAGVLSGLVMQIVKGL